MLEELMSLGREDVAAKRSRRRAFREAQEILAGERRLIDSKYIWLWLVLVATGSGLFMLAVGWILRGVFE